MIFIVVIMYLALLYCMYVMIVSAGDICALRRFRVYDKQKRRRLVASARNRLTWSVFCGIIITVAITITIALGGILAW